MTPYHLHSLNAAGTHSARMPSVCVLITQVGCGMAYRDPFVLPLSSEQKNRAEKAKQELADGTMSDHLALVNALNYYEKVRTTAPTDLTECPPLTPRPCRSCFLPSLTDCRRWRRAASRRASTSVTASSSPSPRSAPCSTSSDR